MIIIGSAKTMSDINENVCDISFKTLELINEIKKKDKNDFQKFLKIKGKTLEKTMDYYSNFEDEKGYYALYKYNGVVFKQLSSNFDELDESKKKYIKKKVIIVSALYGMVPALENIKSYRLDFNSNKFVEKNLYNYWEKDINDSIKRTKPDQVLNLASTEFSKIIDVDELSRNNITYYNLETVTKLSSHALKQVRGLILNYCIENEILNYKQLNNVCIGEYELVVNKNKIIVK